MQRLICLREVIERLFMPKVEIDCETALKMLACSVQAKGRTQRPLLCLTCGKVCTRQKVKRPDS
jgi:hypothetical protein